ncbi:Tether containing UBX domain for GLUT4 [Ooceraea biroi]|uniref:Tether containing UBX domain for GLUT4 n=2 Tax=Ooceraea biroi TaxID=2015173 RepID=A0A026VX99_OOCBI|nr:Tether containing UBX domain for GLUT4 [Ooceraea biroi]
MAANKAVTVLAPNGRRQNVKVTINTTILQVLEEVCQKQGYSVDDYDIKHNRQILDPNTIFRFTGLPNNAQLEMVACKKARSVSNVTIGIQPENGERVMRECSPSTTLAQALTEIYPDSDLERAVLIYMHREVCGREALEKTTLKSLGLNSGKAILRLIYRDPEQLKTQAHVSTPLLPKPVAAVNDSSNIDKNCQRVSPSVTTPHCSKTIGDVRLPETNASTTGNQEKSKQTEVKRDAENEKADAFAGRSQGEKIRNAIEKGHSVASSHHEDHDSQKDGDITETCTAIREDAYEIKFLGERNALIFNQAGTRALPRDELPDSFFDLDLHDARTLMRDAKRRRERLEDAPLLTEAQRQLDQDKHILEQLSKYRRTVIRVQFPDQFVLQGLFGPLETVQTVKNFIKNYLDNPDCEFTVYTAPPKHILNPDVRLIDENLVPSAIIYYSGESSLKPSVKEKLTDPRAAGIEAVRSRAATVRKEQDSVTTSNDRDVVGNQNDRVTPGPSGSGKSSSSSSAQNQNKAPKWFKQTFK